MSLWDDVKSGVGAARSAVGGAVRGAREEFVKGRANRDFDDFLNKAAASAADPEVVLGAPNGRPPPGQDQGLGDDLTSLEEHVPARDPKALHFDPFDLVAAMGFREKPTPMTFGTLAAIAQNVPVVADVIRTRVNQTVMFCHLPEDKHSPGFEVRLRDWRTRSVTPAIEQRQQELERVILHTGFSDPSRPWEAVPLEQFARAFIADSLALDQATFEVVPDRRGVPSYMTIVDPTTVRLLDPATREPGDPFAVQVINGSITGDFTRDELAFCIRNPRSGIRSYGYGQSEIETLVKEVTGFLWSMEYNRRFFSNGAATKGILNFKGTIPEKNLNAFRRQWYSMVAGVSNAWRTPITNAEELQWISLQMNNRDMEYSAWMDFLIKIICARFQIDPAEVNFSYGNTGQSQAMGSAPIEEKLKQSKDLGLRPLVHWFFSCINQNFLWRIDPDFEVIPSGLDSKGAEGEADLLEKQTKVWMTIDEAREVAGYQPLGPDRGGDAIRDPTWLQYVQGKQQAAMGMGGGPPGEGGPDEPAPPQGPGGESAEDFKIGRDDGQPSADDFEIDPPDDGDDGGDRAIKSEAGGARRRVRRIEVDL